MRYRRFGKTNLPLSIFSLGTMGCGINYDNAEATVTTALSQGVNHLETALNYGKSQQYLGLIFKNLPVDRERIYITTKISPHTDAKVLQDKFSLCLQQLQLEYIDCLAIHGINTFEHLEWVRNTYEVWSNAIAKGQIRHLGFSTHGSLELIKAAINTDIFEFINLHYYYFFQRHEEAVALAYEKDMGIFIISPADKGGRLYNPPETLKKLCEPLSPLELNYRFLLQDKRITTLSIGPANPQEISTPLQFADADYPLTTEEKIILLRLNNHIKGQLNADYCSQCYKCLPCPENINIPEVLRLRNLTVAYDMLDYGKYRYRMLENAGHWFPGNKGNRCTSCGECLPRCPQQLDIPQLLLDTHLRLYDGGGRRLWE